MTSSLLITNSIFSSFANCSLREAILAANDFGRGAAGAVLTKVASAGPVGAAVGGGVA